MITKAISQRTSEMEWMPASSLKDIFGMDSTYNGDELAWIKSLSDRRADGKGFAYLLKLCPPDGKMINLVATSRSDEHSWVLDGGFCDRQGHKRAFPGGYKLNPIGHPHGALCAEETIGLVICTGEPDEIHEFKVIALRTTRTHNPP